MNTKAINLVFTLSKYYNISIKKEAIKNRIITLFTQLYSILIDHQLFLSRCYSPFRYPVIHHPLERNVGTTNSVNVRSNDNRGTKHRSL